jgi:hypothetical protein
MFFEYQRVSVVRPLRLPVSQGQFGQQAVKI